MREQEIISLIRERNERGVEELLAHDGALMRYIIAPILPNVQDREECLSEAAMRVWEKIELFDSERGSWASWLTALTRNTALNHLRQRKHAENAEDIPPECAAQGPTPEEMLLRRERHEALKCALDRFPSVDRAIFYRKYYYLQPMIQIASELGMTERAVEGRLYRLKAKLRNALGGEAHE
ncbi:MAG: RNA polymerase sigma factor [Oscillospiraceae bacterium]